MQHADIQLWCCRFAPKDAEFCKDEQIFTNAFVKVSNDAFCFMRVWLMVYINELYQMIAYCVKNTMVYFLWSCDHFKSALFISLNTGLICKIMVYYCSLWCREYKYKEIFGVHHSLPWENCDREWTVKGINLILVICERVCEGVFVLKTLYIVVIYCQSNDVTLTWHWWSLEKNNLWHMQLHRLF